MSKAIEKQGKALLDLERYEIKIRDWMRRGIEATIGIGQLLRKINDEQLYLLKGHETLNHYCEEEFQLEPRSVGRFMGIADSAKVLKESDMELPVNETQVAELSRLEPEHQAMVWNRVLEYADQKDETITTELVRHIVNHRLKELEEEAQEKAAAAAKTAKETPKKPLDGLDLDLGSDLPEDKPERSSGPVEVPARITLTEKGEEALECIRRTCGEPAADAIEHLRVQISERELINWAEEEDPNELTHYVIHERWSVSKAQGFVHQAVDERTRVGQLILLAMANKGRFEVELEGGIQIIIQQLSKKAA